MNDAPRTVIVLSLEDDDFDAELIAERLRAGLDVDVRRARSGTEYEQLLGSLEPDVILSDFSLPGYDGWAALEAAKARAEQVPFVFVSGAIGEDRAIETLRRGATDYVLKDRLDRLVPAVRRALDLATERRRRVAAEAERDRLLASERRAREAAESANRMKDEFLAVVSHELRTPLNAILGWATLLSEPETSPDMHAKGLATIERNARIQVRLIEDILDISRIVTGKLNLRTATVAVAPFVHAAIDAVKPAATAKGVTLVIDVRPDAGQVEGDADRLQQVVWNLVSNAVKFTRKGGRVTVRAHREAETVRIEVQDSGAGIDPDFLPHVFERFRQADASFSRAHGGLGLGLAIVRSLVEMHGGTVHADSRGIGEGATFTISLARAAVADDAPVSSDRGVPSDDSDTALRGVRALVVDDDDDSRDLTAFVLSSRGAEVRTAPSVVDAFDALRVFRPDVIVSDIGMPHVDGYSFIRKLRTLPVEAGRDVPAIALTAYARELDRREAETAGYQKHLAKPVSAPRLVAFVRQLVRPRSATGSAA